LLKFKNGYIEKVFIIYLEYEVKIKTYEIVLAGRRGHKCQQYGNEVASPPFIIVKDIC